MPEHSTRRERPWGSYREYARNQPCTVWMVEMKPGESGSLQSHAHFDELWTLLDDGAEVQVGDQLLRPKAFEEVFIPRGTRHRLTNPRPDRPIRMFEVAYGIVDDARSQARRVMRSSNSQNAQLARNYDSNLATLRASMAGIKTDAEADRLIRQATQTRAYIQFLARQQQQ